MKNIITFLLIICTSLSCKVQELNSFDYNNGPNPWVNAFKDYVFVQCLNQSYPLEASKIIFNNISKYDLYNPYDGFVEYRIANTSFLDSIAEMKPKNIPPFKHNDGVNDKGKNVYLSNCLHFYASRQLDSIAKNEYKKYLKNLQKTGLD